MGTNDAVTATLQYVAPEAVPAGPADAARLPEQWRPIAAAAQPGQRREAALELWRPAFLDLVPRFADALRERLVDVAAYLTDDGPALVYTVRARRDQLVTWVGFDPRTFEEPHFWGSFPAPVQEFLREVHAGFVSGERRAFGLSRPADMLTLGEMADYPEGIPEWEDGTDISSTRLLCISTDGGVLLYCLSPDLSPGDVALVYEGDIDLRRLGIELDDLLIQRLEEYPR